MDRIMKEVKTMSDENRLVTVLMVITVLLLIMVCSCTYREPTDRITRDSIEICGCDRLCVLRMCNIKGALDINESEYRKHCK